MEEEKMEIRSITYIPLTRRRLTLTVIPVSREEFKNLSREEYDGSFKKEAEMIYRFIKTVFAASTRAELKELLP